MARFDNLLAQYFEPERIVVDDDDEFDPGKHSVADVLAYVEANPDDAERVLEAETAGKGRKGILGDPE